MFFLLLACALPSRPATILPQGATLPTIELVLCTGDQCPTCEVLAPLSYTNAGCCTTPFEAAIVDGLDPMSATLTGQLDYEHEQEQLAPTSVVVVGGTFRVPDIPRGNADTGYTLTLTLVDALGRSGTCGLDYYLPDIIACNDQDKDGFERQHDCEDCDAAVNPGAEEVVDGIDNDCDGLIDEVD